MENHVGHWEFNDPSRIEYYGMKECPWFIIYGKSIINGRTYSYALHMGKQHGWVPLPATQLVFSSCIGIVNNRCSNHVFLKPPSSRNCGINAQMVR
jgi:hypothetical protein